MFELPEASRDLDKDIMEPKGVHVEGLDCEPSPPVSVARSHHEVDVAVARLPGVATSRLGCSRRDLSIHIER